jgi:ribulose-5-phosphate 4-epimerase/fuculose-1-phosphate aldolase
VADSTGRTRAYDGGMGGYPPLRLDSYEPDAADTASVRLHRMRRTALAYRLFGAYHWGEQGDGHISARDPEHTDSFWMLRYGVPFGAATVADLVRVGPDGAVADANGNVDPEINITAYYIHWPIHEARPDAVCAAHTHTPYGTPWSANAEPFRPISQEATAFVGAHAVYDGDDVNVQSTDGGKRIAAALGEGRGAILRNHGLLTVGASVDEAIGWFVMMERVAEVHVKAHRPQPIDDEAARQAAVVMGSPHQAWHAFNWSLRSRVPDPSVVDAPAR